MSDHQSFYKVKYHQEIIQKNKETTERGELKIAGISKR